MDKKTDTNRLSKLGTDRKEDRFFLLRLRTGVFCLKKSSVKLMTLSAGKNEGNEKKKKSDIQI